MAIKPKRIKDKLLMEAYTPAQSDEDGYSDGIEFSNIAGHKRFHSFQVWREKAGGRPTYVYGLTLKQVERIAKQADKALLEELTSVKKALIEAQEQIKQSKATDTAASNTVKTDAIKDLEHENRWLRQEVLTYQQRMPNFFVPNGRSTSVRATSIPMGGSSTYRIRRRPR